MNVSETSYLPPPGKALVAGALVLAASLSAAGCGEAKNTGRVEVTDIRVDDERGSCLDTAFPLDPSFYAARERVDSVGVFVQSNARLGQDADLLYIEVFEPDRAREESVSFGGPASASTPVTAEVAVDESCPDLNTSFRVQGQVQFESLETDAGGRVVGELLEGTVVDSRSGETVAGSIDGRWDFAVEVGAPYQTYPTYGDEYQREP